MFSRVKPDSEDCRRFFLHAKHRRKNYKNDFVDQTHRMIQLVSDFRGDDAGSLLFNRKGPSNIMIVKINGTDARL
uniref:Uncharacterized protein n=1 Tax=Romanomermis culicivorax TaxID=13658 RepID=A0A915JV36_ROMCU